jgi:hypothetical protein
MWWRVTVACEYWTLKKWHLYGVSMSNMYIYLKEQNSTDEFELSHEGDQGKNNYHWLISHNCMSQLAIIKSITWLVI